MGFFYNGDGCSSKNPTENDATGGVMADKKDLLSNTLHAPKRAFGRADDYLLQGKTLDDLLLPLHATFRFFAMQK